MTNLTRTDKNTFPLSAVLILGTISIGWLFWTGHDISTQTERQGIIAAIWRHVGFGVVLMPVLFGYLGLRFQSLRYGQAQRTSIVSFGLLSSSVTFLLLTGPVVVWTYGSDLKIFDWFVISNPIGKLPAIHDPLETAHVFIAKTVPYLLAFDIVVFATKSFRR